MTDIQLLFVVLTLIYGWECACWLRRGTVGFITCLGRRWTMAHPGGLLGNHQGGFIFANPLPPLGSLLTGNQYPFSLSPEALLAYVPFSINPAGRPAQSAQLLLFTEIREIKVSEKKILANGAPLLKSATHTRAHHLGTELRELLKVEPAKRPAAIEKIFKGSFDTREIERRWDQFRRGAKPARVLTNGLFAFLFVLAPALIWTLGFRQCWLVLLIGLFGFTLSIAILFRKLHQQFYPSAADDRFTHFIIILLSPVSSIRAVDVLSRSLLENYHPLAIAKVFCNKQQFAGFASRVLRELRYPALPLCSRDEPVAKQAERYSSELWLKIVERFLREDGLDLAELTQAPKPSDGSCRSYCPRCLAQFTTAPATCADCGGRPTVPFVSEQPRPQPA